MPSTEEEWLGIAARFKERWNIPNTLGAIDGKDIRIQCPPNSGSVFYNYKHFYSLFFLALVDGDYRVRYYDIGAEGKASDGGVWKKCSLRQDFENPENPKNIPREKEVGGITGNLPFFFVGDDAFQLTPYMMKPYPTIGLTKRDCIFNSRLSRGRRIVENVFGIIAARFRIFRQEIAMHPDGVEKVVRAAVILHNMLQELCSRTYFQRNGIDYDEDRHDIVPGLRRREEPVTPLEATKTRNASLHAKNIREHLADYFVSRSGAVHWQYGLAGVQ